MLSVFVIWLLVFYLRVGEFRPCDFFFQSSRPKVSVGYRLRDLSNARWDPFVLLYKKLFMSRKAP